MGVENLKDKFASDRFVSAILMLLLFIDIVWQVQWKRQSPLLSISRVQFSSDNTTELLLTKIEHCSTENADLSREIRHLRIRRRTCQPNQDDDDDEDTSLGPLGL